MEEKLTIDELIDKLKSINKVDVMSLLADWDEQKHEIVVNKDKYPDRVMVVEPAKEEYNVLTGKPVKVPAKKKTEPINRLPLPLEKDIVNIHAAFTVGTEPSMDFTANDDAEQVLFDTLNDLLVKNKSKYDNKAIVRAWLSETLVAEYWYLDEDERFWNGIYKKYGLKGVKPKFVPKSTIWSPFRGDTLHPLFDKEGKLTMFGRGYEIKEDDDTIECFTILTDTHIYEYEYRDGWQQVEVKPHQFGGIPVIFASRSETLCAKIRPLRERLEAILSSYADSIDYFFFPYLLLMGDVANAEGRPKSRVIKLTNGADAKYLTWEQVPDTVKLEMETITNQIYSLTNTPRISFDNLQGFGKSLSGTAFKFMFMGAHMAVENHAEDIGEFFQRRVNLLVKVLGNIWSHVNDASQSIMIEVDIVPYMIDNLKDRVETAVEAVDGKIWSIEEGIMFAGNADAFADEVERIKEQNGLKSPSEE